MSRVKKYMTDGTTPEGSPANSHIVAPRHHGESQEMDKPQAGTMAFTADNELKGSGIIEPVAASVSSAKIEEEKFMNELVTVMIHQTTDKNANPIPEVSVNGRIQRFVRGHEQRVRRCYVEVLARAKQTIFGNVKTRDAEGNDMYHYPSTTAEVLPFAVIGDTPKGQAWLKKLLASPQ